MNRVIGSFESCADQEYQSLIQNIKDRAITQTLRALILVGVVFPLLCPVFS